MPARAAAVSHAPLVESDEQRADLLEHLFTLCAAVENVAEGVNLQRIVSEHLAKKSITDEQACDLNGTLENAMQNLDQEKSS